MNLLKNTLFLEFYYYNYQHFFNKIHLENLENQLKNYIFHFLILFFNINEKKLRKFIS